MEYIFFKAFYKTIPKTCSFWFLRFQSIKVQKIQEKVIFTSLFTRKLHVKVIPRSSEGHLTYSFYWYQYALPSCQISLQMEFYNLGIQHFTQFWAISACQSEHFWLLWPQCDRVNMGNVVDVSARELGDSVWSKNVWKMSARVVPKIDQSWRCLGPV